VKLFNSFFLLLLFCANQKKIYTKRSASDAVGLLPRSAENALRNLKGILALSIIIFFIRISRLLTLNFQLASGCATKIAYATNIIIKRLRILIDICVIMACC
jgi:hypothetical protein